MATITRSLSKRVNGAGTSEVLLRVCVSHTKQIRLKSGIYVKPALWRGGGFVKLRLNSPAAAELHEAEKNLADVEQRIVAKCIERGGEVTAEELRDLFREPAKTTASTIYDHLDRYLTLRAIPARVASAYRVLGRCLHRWEMYTRLTRDTSFRVDIALMQPSDLALFEQYLDEEWKYYDKFPAIFRDYPAAVRPQNREQRPQQRGRNVISAMMKKMRSFWRWCIEQGVTDNNPFAKFRARSEHYGTPYYLTLEERDRLAAFDFGKREQLAHQRDVFVFQCLIGCRVSDLYRLRREDIVGGAVEYVAAKTRGEGGAVIRVPLNSRAREILERYNEPDGRLLPFISQQRYNDAIKEMLRLAGIDRLVTVIDSKSGEDVKRPIWQVASSHMARRTFIGNLYKKVKDPALVGSLSGHADGSRSFSRYREIDEEIKEELVKLIE